jgi:outer membrane protein TolC
MRYVTPVAVLIALTAAAEVHAQPVALRVDEAVSRGLATSHRLDETAARGEAARAIADQRRAVSLPQVAAQAGYTRTNHVDEFGVVSPNNQLRILYPDVPDNFRSRLDVQWPIYTGGRLAAIERAARGEAVASSADLEAARSDLRLEITRVYWALVTAIESVRVLDQSLARTEAHLDVVRSQLDAGLVPPHEVLTVQAQQSRQRMLGIQARVNRDVTEAELGRLIGAAPGTRIDPVSPLEAPVRNVSSETARESAIEAARESRHERRALLDRLRAAGEREQAAGAGTRPTIAVSGGLDYARPNPRVFPREAAWKTAWDASVNVNWPLFDGGRARAELAEASAVARGLQARLDEFDEVLAVEVRQRQSELEASRAVIAAADEAVRAATEARRVAGERFAGGVSGSLDVLDAQVALLQADLDRTQAMANARVAEARLARALGR